MHPDNDRLYAMAAVVLDECEQLAVGPGLHSRLIELAAMPMNGECALRAAALWGKLTAHCEARAMVPVAEACEAADVIVLGTGHDAQQLVAHDLAARCKLPFGVTMAQVSLVGQVEACLPESWMALDRGEWTLAHLKSLARAVEGASPRLAQAVEAHIVGKALGRDWTPRTVEREALKVLIALDPDAAARRAEAAKAAADVRLFPDRDDTATLVANGDAAPLRQVMDAVEDKARGLRRDGDARPVGVRRLAALTELVLGPEQAARPAVETRLVIDLPTWLGLTHTPGEIVGYGPVTADTARELSANATIRRMITDPLTGELLDLGRTRYRPSTPLRRLVEATHPTCTAPGCTRPAVDCDLDHREEFDPGGPTDNANLHPLCRVHHNLKTKKLWRVEVEADGTEIWTTAFGHTVRKPPAGYLTDLPEPLDTDEADPPDEAPAMTDPDPPLGELIALRTPPPLDDEQYAELTDVLDNSWGEFATRAYDTLRAAGLIA